MPSAPNNLCKAWPFIFVLLITILIPACCFLQSSSTFLLEMFAMRAAAKVQRGSDLDS